VCCLLKEFEVKSGLEEIKRLQRDQARTVKDNLYRMELKSAAARHQDQQAIFSIEAIRQADLKNNLFKETRRLLESENSRKNFENCDNQDPISEIFSDIKKQSWKRTINCNRHTDENSNPITIIIPTNLKNENDEATSLLNSNNSFLFEKFEELQVKFEDFKSSIQDSFPKPSPSFNSTQLCNQIQLGTKERLKKLQLKSDREYRSLKRYEEPLEEKTLRLQKNRERKIIQRESLSQDKNERRLLKDQIYHFDMRQNEILEKKEIRLKKDREKKRLNRLNEMQQDKKGRLEQLRIERSLKLKSESKEQKDDRLLKKQRLKSQKLAKEFAVENENEMNWFEKLADMSALEKSNNLKLRRLARMPPNRVFENFKKSIEVYANKCCEICTKRCYPSQISSLHVKADCIPVYLPEEILKLDLALCHRCKFWVQNKKKGAPPKAYWNELNPGPIPFEILSLTKLETRLLARVKLYLKIVKYTGSFGHYGFNGQNILFAQDIFEIVEKLPTMLPLTLEEADIIVVTEELDNIIKTREYQINRDRVSLALNWLIRNNACYKDVINNSKNVHLDILDAVRVEQPSEVSVSEYRNINDESRILRGSWNQASKIFNSHNFAGVQCCAMALAFILKSTLLPPSNWNANSYNDVMLRGNDLYTQIRQNLGISAPTNGYLGVEHFDHIREGFKAFATEFSLDYDADTQYFGNLKDRKITENGVGLTLVSALTNLFQEHDYGNLIANGYSYAVSLCNGKFYFSNSHACGPQGEPSKSSNGQACVVECDSLEELHRIIRRTTTSGNIQFTINYVDVFVLKEELDILASQNREKVEEIPVQASICLPVDSIQMKEESVLKEVPGKGEKVPVNRITRKTEKNIVNDNHELKTEEMAWFQLFPYGVNGINQRRISQITPLDYFQSRIMGSDNRFERNDYLFYALSTFENMKVKSNISVCGKKIRLANEMVEDVHLYVKNIRGTSSYWKTVLNELLAQIRCLGSPHLYLTLSCNDLNWPDMIKALLLADGQTDRDVDSVGVFEVQTLIERYPVVLSRQFMMRFNELIKCLKSNSSKVFRGKLKDHWWRVEFQNRGSPHIHLLLWIDNFPDVETEQGIAVVDEMISCQIPDEDDELAELVKTLQTHRHTTACYKNNVKYCRFGFPRPQCVKTRILAPDSADFIRSGGRTCEIVRSIKEKFINNYNAVVLKLWGANMDIQICGNDENIAYYLAKYLTKAEPQEVRREIKKAIETIKNEDSETAKKMFKISMILLNHRQVSACECAFRLCHLRLRESSRKCHFLNTRLPDQRYKVLNFYDSKTAHGFCSNLIERYENRPISHENYDFKNMCLMEFAMLFEPCYKGSEYIEDENEDDGDQDAYQTERYNKIRSRLIHLLNGGAMLIRTKPAVVRSPHFVHDRDPNNYFYSLLAQYCPFRHENELTLG
jgi:Helitron helicase-like domain at N-terminus